MQTDLLFKQLNTSLAELKEAIEKFDKHTPPSTAYAEQLHISITQTNKLVSAYLVLKEQHEISPELNLHLKLMEVVPPAEIVEVVKAQLEEPIEVVEEKIIIPQPVKMVDPILEVSLEQNIYPKLNININDKFRFINELFSANSNEYNIAIEHLNSANKKEDALAYVNGLKGIYLWKDDNELAKTLIDLIEKRFS
jgi:DNA-binding transcriptional MerR regulator